MGKESDLLNEKILASAQSEFYTFGYQNASLRRICRGVGLTTGALYKRFSSKDQLFKAVLAPTLEAIEAYGESQKTRDYDFLEKSQLSRMWEHRLEDLEALMQLLYEHKDNMRLLLFRSQGSSLANFKSDMIYFATIETYHYLERAHKEGKIRHLLEYEYLQSCMTAYYTALFEPLAQDWPKSQAMSFCTSVLQFFNWEALLDF
ncbi:Transcriptional regulator, TetR family [Streptococcus sp. DD11]|uniref:TetR/AcrR family transcriptional regulator n=1 Tax=Streptococcus sp. DD11 TaxID=1777879 RepID=UPI0007950609|nr:TetR/AcrR family transcriptional regulator [Streptococcus sp. DD11]KXT79651.1 Transcriptional regulator, TetR family [Streptococcus sp. DD11]